MADKQSSGEVFPSCWWIVVGWIDDDWTDVLLAKTWPKAKLVREEVFKLLKARRLVHLTIYDGAGDAVYVQDGSVELRPSRQLQRMSEPAEPGRYLWSEQGGFVRLPGGAPDPHLLALLREVGDHRSTTQWFDGKRACPTCGHPGWRQRL